ncbi:hypothetical protein [Colwellia sp. E150_009]
MEHIKTTRKRWRNCLLFTIAALSPQAFSANYITSLIVEGDIVYFTTEDDKTEIAGCVTSPNPQRWSVESDATKGLYDLLYVAQKSNQPIDITSANDCSLDSVTERASTINVNYSYSATQTASIASNLNFVARSTVEVSEGASSPSVVFTLNNTSTGVVIASEQPATVENGYYLHDFGALAVGSYSLAIKATSGDDESEENIPFHVVYVAAEENPVIYTFENNLYVKLLGRLGGKYLKISLNETTGHWVVTEIFPTPSEWDNYTLTESDYDIEFIGDELHDFKMTNSSTSTEVVFNQTETGYSHETPNLQRKIIFIHTDSLGSPVAETNEQGELQ